MSFPGRTKRTTRQLLEIINRKVTSLMATDQEVLESVTTLKLDLEGLALTAKAEFEKLEAEVKAGKPTDLTPLKEAIDGIDTAVKAAVVPST